MWCFNVNFFRIPSNSIFIKKTFASNMAIFNTWKIISVSFAASVDKSLTFFGAWVVMKSSTDISAWTSFLKKQSNLTHFLGYVSHLCTGCFFLKSLIGSAIITFSTIESQMDSLRGPPCVFYYLVFISFMQYCIHD